MRSFCFDTAVGFKFGCLAVMDGLDNFQLRHSFDNFTEFVQRSRWHHVFINKVEFQVNRVLGVFVDVVVTELFKHAGNRLNGDIFQETLLKCEMCHIIKLGLLLLKFRHFACVGLGKWSF